MQKGLENAAIAMRNKIQNIQIVANNLANVNTTGFKRSLSFSDVFEDEKINVNRKYTDFSEGAFVETKNPLNVAISGDAYFTVKTPDGDHLTKNGNFVVDNEGYLSTQDGHRVLGENGEINLQEELVDKSGSLSISKNGEIKSAGEIVNVLRISEVEDMNTLKKSEGQRFFNEDKQYKTASSSSFEVHQGYLESSNTNAIVEMQAMIQLQKDYEASQKMITSIDNMMSQVKEMGKV